MILLSLSFSLLALVAGMYLLDKTRKESLGKFFGFISWLVICVSLLAMICALAQGAFYTHGRHQMGGGMEMCRPGMSGCGDMMEDEHCGGMMKDKCCEWEEEETMEKEGTEKEIQKEIQIEKDTVKK
jgi:hypothetical protein